MLVVATMGGDGGACKLLSIPFVLSWGGNISSDSFLPSILLLVVIIITVVIVVVILIVVVVLIVGVVIVVAIIEVGRMQFPTGQGRISSRCTVANVFFVFLVTLARYNTILSRSNQRMRPTAPSNREPLSEDILGATTQRDTGSYYPKRYWELLPKEILGAITQRDTRMSYGKMELGGARRRMTWRQFILALGLHSKEEMAESGFRAYWAGSERVIPDKGDLRDYRIEISSDMDFLGLVPSYVHIRDPYLFHHAEGRKSRARFSRGHFIRRLAAHFGLVGDQGLRGLTVVVSELPVIDLHELGRLNICVRFGDTWAWVAPGPERQQAVAAGAHGAAEGGPTADEGTLAVLAPVQAPQSPPPVPQPRTMWQRIDRLEEEVREMRQSVVGLRGVVESSITMQTRVSTWLISYMTQLMDVIGRTY
ncbi:hypothetical protein Tco_1335409 [Tanacetum coccineum]